VLANGTFVLKVKACGMWSGCRDTTVQVADCKLEERQVSVRKGDIKQSFSLRLIQGLCIYNFNWKSKLASNVTSEPKVLQQIYKNL